MHDREKLRKTGRNRSKKAWRAPPSYKELSELLTFGSSSLPKKQSRRKYFCGSTFSNIILTKQL